MYLTAYDKSEEGVPYFFVLTPSMVGQFVRHKTWGIQAYYKKLYGIRTPKSHEMNRGEQIHEKFGYTNKQKFIKRFMLRDDVLVELRGVPDKIDDMGRPWEAKTLDGTYVTSDKYEGARAQLLCYLFMMDKPVGFVDFINRQTEHRVSGFPKPVMRNDRELFRILNSFVDELIKQKQLKEVVNYGGSKVERQGS